MKLKDGTTYRPMPDDIESWRQAYPGIDVMVELRKMGVWLNANPSKRKTRRGINRFIVNWLGRARPAVSTSTRHTSLHDDLTDTSWAN